MNFLIWEILSSQVLQLKCIKFNKNIHDFEIILDFVINLIWFAYIVEKTLRVLRTYPKYLSEMYQAVCNST